MKLSEYPELTAPVFSSPHLNGAVAFGVMFMCNLTSKALPSLVRCSTLPRDWIKHNRHYYEASKFCPQGSSC
jgi:hypothetical protein